MDAFRSFPEQSMKNACLVILLTWIRHFTADMRRWDALARSTILFEYEPTHFSKAFDLNRNNLAGTHCRRTYFGSRAVSLATSAVAIQV
jgi:hypothetical protein